MKKLMTRSLAIVLTVAMALGLMLVNPFAAMKANAEEAPSEFFKYSGKADELLGSSIIHLTGESPEEVENKLYTALFRITKEEEIKYALCIDPGTGIVAPTNYNLVTATGDYDFNKVANILNSISTDSTPDEIAGAQAAIWTIMNNLKIQTQYYAMHDVTTGEAAVAEHFVISPDGDQVDINTVYSDGGVYYSYTSGTPTLVSDCSEVEIAAAYYTKQDGTKLTEDQLITIDGKVYYHVQNGNGNGNCNGGHNELAKLVPAITQLQFPDGTVVTTGIVVKYTDGLSYVFTPDFERVAVTYVLGTESTLETTQEPDTFLTDRPYKTSYDAFMAGGITRATLQQNGQDIAFAELQPEVTSQRLITLISYDYVAPVTPTVITDDPAILADAGEVLGATRRVSTEDVSGKWFALFGISALALTGIVLKKKRDEHEVETV